MCWPGGCRTPSTRASASKPSTTCWPAMARRRSSTPTRAASSRAAPSPGERQPRPTAAPGLWGCGHGAPRRVHIPTGSRTPARQPGPKEPRRHDQQPEYTLTQTPTCPINRGHLTVTAGPSCRPTLWRKYAAAPTLGGSGTGSFLLHYFSTNRVDSRGLRWIPVDSTAANKRLPSNVLDHKLRVVSQLPKHGRTGSTPAASTI